MIDDFKIGAVEPLSSIITLIRQPDGNWIGKAIKYGKEIEVRDYGPEVVLAKLLTHE